MLHVGLAAEVGRVVAGGGVDPGAEVAELDQERHDGQYVSKDFAAAAARHGLRLSRGAVGSSADNALAESLNASCKRELLTGAHAFPDAVTCRRRIFWWANRYNTRRRSIGVGRAWCDVA